MTKPPFGDAVTTSGNFWKKSEDLLHPVFWKAMEIEAYRSLKNDPYCSSW
jgi:hypothetical protein